MSDGRNIKYVDTQETILSKSPNQAMLLLYFNNYLNKKRLWTINGQRKLIQMIDKYVKEAIEENDQELLNIGKVILQSHLDNNLIDLKKLNSIGKNPLTVFLMDCESTKVHESKEAINYMNFLINLGDNVIHPDIYSDVQENCKSNIFNLKKVTEKEKREKEEDEQNKEEIEELMRNVDAPTRRRVQRMISSYKQ
jgi:hypothetical protein